MGLTSDIENFLLDRMKLEKKEYIEIGRNDLAEKFNCAPSQINYVLTTRFTTYQGYYVESRRGGSGYIKIIKLDMTENQLINNIINDTIDEEITFDKVKHILNSLVKEDIITKKEALIIQHCLDDQSLKDIDRVDRKTVRASIFKNILIALIRD